MHATVCMRVRLTQYAFWKSTHLPVLKVLNWDPACFDECQILLVYAKTSMHLTDYGSFQSNTEPAHL